MRLPLAALSSLVVFSFACGSSDKNRTLSRLEPAGDRCPSGGVAVVSGADDNGDGDLDDTEIEATDLLCTNNTLTRVDAIAPGEICPAGGTQINAGVDDNDDGTLQNEEVDTTQNICKGTLVRSTTLGPDEAACYGRGGVRLEVGIDDNGNDVLDVDEVDVTTITCNQPGTSVPPPGPDGTGTINLSGGSSSTTAGSGGGLQIEHGASGGGSLAIFRTGTANAGFTMPTHTTIPGANPLTLAGNTTATEVVTPGSAPAAGELYAAGPAGGPHRLYVSNGGTAADEPVVTSLVIPAGATLSFTSNAGIATLSVVLDGDLVNNGTITRTGTNKALALRPLNYVGAAGSAINLPGAAAASGHGGLLTIETQESIFNEGNLNTSGGTSAATPGGNGGGIALRSLAGSTFNRGELRSVGGDCTAATSTGGGGGGILVESQGGRVANTGNVFSNGGAGTGTGGPGAGINLTASPGDVLNSGNLNSFGASPAQCVSSCNGGPAGTITVRSYGGGVTSSGELRASGGAVPVAAASCGGSGNSIYIESQQGSVNTLNQGNIRLSGNIDAKGGTSGTCGSPNNGGTLSIYSTPRFPLGQEVLLFGYVDIVLNGGASSTSTAGSGGDFLARRNNFNDFQAAYGAILNYANVTTNGGDSSGSFTSGGQGGYVNMTFQDGYAFLVSGIGANRVFNAGAWRGDGGDALSGYAGTTNSQFQSALMYGPEGVENTGALTFNGGEGRPNSGIFAGPGGGIILSSDVGQVTNSGPFVSNGGGAAVGGYGGHQCLEGSYVVNSGALTTNGGNGAQGGAGGGGSVTLTSYTQATSNTGVVTQNPGTGTPAAPAGLLLIDATSNRCYGSPR